MEQKQQPTIIRGRTVIVQLMPYRCILKLMVLGFAGCLMSAMWPAESPGASVRLDANAINTAELSQTNQRSLPAALIARAQILLDRAHFSPGEIDAKDGENFKKAIYVFAAANGLASKAGLTKEVWLKLVNDSDPAVIEYQISEDDIRGPFDPHLPSKMEDMKDLSGVPYRSPAEALAEKFHMSEDLLKTLNDGSAFDQAGTTIFVANVMADDAPAKATRVEIDKSTQTVRALGSDNSIIAYYPATVGSEEKPSPSGALAVTTVQPNPNYRYNPEYRFRDVRSARPFTIRPGPNNPVGIMWIGLSAKGYGIHGTPEPSKVSKAESHGCVRLTNWDANDLSRRVAKGTTVVFLDTSTDRGNAGKKRRKA